MIISCPSCKKKFDVDEALIPENGRILQCSSCKNKWHFKKKLEQTNEDFRLKKKDIKIKASINEIPNETENIIVEAEKNLSKNEIKPNVQTKISIIKVILIFLISFVTLIILLDTFKVVINNFLPGFIFFLENFYITINDIYLFIKDLVRE
tara:strand:- start:234 stop:686 length:453 start_codon:yes stop_codon:yes gene_type:complete